MAMFDVTMTYQPVRFFTMNLNYPVEAANVSDAVHLAISLMRIDTLSDPWPPVAIEDIDFKVTEHAGYPADWPDWVDENKLPN